MDHSLSHHVIAATKAIGLYTGGDLVSADAFSMVHAVSSALNNNRGHHVGQSTVITYRGSIECPSYGTSLTNSVSGLL